MNVITAEQAREKVLAAQERLPDEFWEELEQAIHNEQEEFDWYDTLSSAQRKFLEREPQNYTVIDKSSGISLGESRFHFVIRWMED